MYIATQVATQAEEEAVIQECGYIGHDWQTILIYSAQILLIQS